jgi:phytoene desaturase
MNTEKKKKHIVIIGAGPGGLTSAMLLASKGYDVTVFEKKPHIGGRNSLLELGDFKFELGPTFVMLPDVFKETFVEAGKNMDDYMKLIRLDPMYQLHYADGKDFSVYFDKDNLKKEIARVFPSELNGYDKYMLSQKLKYDRLYKCLTVPYMRWYNYFRLKLLKAFSVMDLGKSVHGVLSKYFKDEDFKIAMAFQAKYLGMSPWKCPGAFTILSYVEHAFGVYHPEGGVHKISEGLAKASVDSGAVIKLNTGVKEIIFDGKKAIGVELENGEKVMADSVIMNADFAHGVSHLIPEAKRPKYTDKNLSKRAYSCSTFMLYLGLSKKYDIPHHNIVFSSDYRKNTEEIYEKLTLSEDPSFYIQNASATDSSLAPEGKSTIYILVPAPNLNGDIDWEKEKQAYRDLIITKLEERTELKDIREHIEVERIVTPLDWQNEIDVYKGGVFNLSHSLDQMLYLRPHNRLEGYSNLYIVGGGTHPGSGLPTIIESGRISARLIDAELGN